MEANSRSRLIRTVRPLLRPGALLIAGLACYAVGLFAFAQGPVVRFNLYSCGADYAVSDGEFFGICERVDPAAFHPSLPDLSPYEPRGFGFGEPAQIPGGSLYENRCRVVAIGIGGQLYERTEYVPLVIEGVLRWTLVPGFLMVGLAGLMAGRAVRRSRRARAAIFGALGVSFDSALAPLMLTASLMNFGNYRAVYADLAGAMVLLAIAGLLIALAGTLALQRDPAVPAEIRIVRGQTAVAVALALGLSGSGAWFFSGFWPLCP